MQTERTLTHSSASPSNNGLTPVRLSFPENTNLSFSRAAVSTQICTLHSEVSTSISNVSTSNSTDSTWHSSRLTEGKLSFRYAKGPLDCFLIGQAGLRAPRACHLSRPENNPEGLSFIQPTPRTHLQTNFECCMHEFHRIESAPRLTRLSLAYSSIFNPSPQIICLQESPPSVSNILDKFDVHPFKCPWGQPKYRETWVTNKRPLGASFGRWFCKKKKKKKSCHVSAIGTRLIIRGRQRLVVNYNPFVFHVNFTWFPNRLLQQLLSKSEASSRVETISRFVQLRLGFVSNSSLIFMARVEEEKCGIMDVSETTFYLTALQGKRIQICSYRNEGSANVDPLKLLESTLFQVVLSKLRAIDLARCFLVCRDWKACAEEDYLWDSHCLDLWQGKDIASNTHCLANPKWRFYSTSIWESRRTIITLDELCSYAWRFRFKKDIGEYWKSYDPYWQGLPSMQRFFHRDGFVSAGPHDRVWGGHECQWKFASANAKAEGQFVRINCWPPLVVSRTPKWGWKMENCYAIYSSEDFEAY